MNNFVAQNNYSSMPQHGFADFDGNYNYVGTDPRLGGSPRPSIRMSGGLNIPGAPGNNIQQLPYFGGALNPTTMPYVFGQDYGGLQNLAQMLPPIDPASHRNQMRQKKIYNKGKGTDNLFEADTFLRRTGPQLPLAQAPANFDRKYVS